MSRGAGQVTYQMARCLDGGLDPGVIEIVTKMVKEMGHHIVDHAIWFDSMRVSEGHEWGSWMATFFTEFDDAPSS